jgi:hypothetical protein
MAMHSACFSANLRGGFNSDSAKDGQLRTHLQDEPTSNVDAPHGRDAPFECLFSPLPLFHFSASLPFH